MRRLIAILLDTTFCTIGEKVFEGASAI